TLFSRDIVKRFVTGLSSSQMLMATRCGVALACVAAIVFTNLNLDSNALDWSYLSMALRGSGIFLPLTFCVFFPHRVKPIYGLLSMAAGIFVGLTWKFIGIPGVHALIPALTLNLVFLVGGMSKKG
ncbi:MAG: sodium:solute symporter family protein, partial [Phascolarctobacterium sp.]|nr:sodium:solute symporter family protein [Candidatus Phascolarctobacterium equi]